MDLPPVPAIIQKAPLTNTFHLTFTWDLVTNAQWYAVIVKTNGVEAFRRYSMTNWVTVSNLSSYLDQYQFTAIATNSLNALVSDESPPAPTRLVIIQDGTNVLNLQPTNSRAFFTNTHPVSIKQWDAQQYLKPD